MQEYLNSVEQTCLINELLKKSIFTHAASFFFLSFWDKTAAKVQV